MGELHRRQAAYLACVQRRELRRDRGVEVVGSRAGELARTERTHLASAERGQLQIV